MSETKVKHSDKSELVLLASIIANIASCVASYFIVKGHFVGNFGVVVMMIASVLAVYDMISSIIVYRSAILKNTKATWYDTLTWMVSPFIFSVLMTIIGLSLN